MLNKMNKGTMVSMESPIILRVIEKYVSIAVHEMSKESITCWAMMAMEELGLSYVVSPSSLRPPSPSVPVPPALSP